MRHLPFAHNRDTGNQHRYANFGTAPRATGDLIDLIARKMIEEEKIREDYARSLIRELK